MTKIPEDLLAGCVSALLRRQGFPGPIHDPACGTGTIVDVVLERGGTATGSDIIDQSNGRFGVSDFLEDYQPRVNIICCPPCRLFVDFVQHALDVAADRVAMLITDECYQKSVGALPRITRHWISRQKHQDTGLNWLTWEPYERYSYTDYLNVRPRNRPKVLELQKQKTRGPLVGPEPGKDLPLNVVSIGQLPSYPGIYAINSPLGPYVGQSKSLKSRLKEHLKRLSEVTHHNENLQMIFKERPAELSARVLEYAPPGLWGKRIQIWLDRREAFWMHRYGNSLNVEPPKAEPFDEDKHALEKHKIKQKIGVLKSELKEKEKKLASAKINRERKVRELNEKIAKFEIRYNQLSEKRSFIANIFWVEDDELKEVSKKLEDLRLERSIYAHAHTHESPEQLETEIQSINIQIVSFERIARLLEAEEQIFPKPE